MGWLPLRFVGLGLVAEDKPTAFSNGVISSGLAPSLEELARKIRCSVVYK